MELEFLRDGSPDCPIVSLSPSSPLESRQLYKALDKLISGTKKRIAMHTLPVISPVDGCELFALAGQLDLGVIRLKEENALEWTLTPESWGEVLEMLKPFSRQDCHAGISYQWLDETSDISVLISTGHRRW